MNKKDVNIDIVANRIRNIRKSLGLSMEEFASRIDDRAKSGTVSNWETGKNLPNNKRLNKIAELGNMSLDQLLYGSLEEYVMKKVKNYIENNDSVILSEDGKRIVVKDALEQSLRNPMIFKTFAQKYEEDKHILDESIRDEVNQATLRLLNHTKFTNRGFITFTTNALNGIKRNAVKYLNNGIDEKLYDDTINIIENAKNDVFDLQDKHDID